MSNDYYNHSTYPANGAFGSSSALRAELELLEAGFALLPTITGNGSKLLAVNAGATALEAIATTGTGSGVRATSPTLVTPTLGVATATSINKVALTAPATSATLTIADGKTLTASNTLTLTGTDGSSVAFGTGGTVLYSGGALGTPSSGTLTNCTFPTLNQNTTGSAAKLTTARAINGVAFDGTAAITVTAAAGTLSGTTLAANVVNASLNAVTPTGGTFAVTGALSATGNVTLGDAATDSVAVSGYMGVGGAATSNIGVYLTSSALSGVAIRGAHIFPTAPATATTSVYGVMATVGTAAAAFTLTDAVAFYANGVNKGAGSTVTNAYGVYVADQSSGANNYGIALAVSSGTNKWNIYASGTAANYMAGRLLLGTTTDDGVNKLQVSGSVAFDGKMTSNTLRVNGSSTPASATATGVQGDITWDASYVYVCTASNTWKRAALATW